MRRLASIFVAVIPASPALAQEPVGCDKFKWPVDQEISALRVTNLATLVSGADIGAPSRLSGVLKLQPITDAHLPMAPERSSKNTNFAGFLTFKSVVTPGVYTVSLSAPAWLDVIQDGKMLKPIDFSGVTGCDGIRKVVKFEVAAKPLTIQISDAVSDQIKIAVLPVSR